MPDVEPLKLICDVPAFHVRLVVVAKFNAVDKLVLMVTVLEFREIDRVLELLELKPAVVIAKLPLSNEPYVTVKV